MHIKAAAVSYIQDIGDAGDATGDAISRQEMHHLVDNKANKKNLPGDTDSVDSASPGGKCREMHLLVGARAKRRKFFLSRDAHAGDTASPGKKCREMRHLIRRSGEW